MALFQVRNDWSLRPGMAEGNGKGGARCTPPEEDGAIMAIREEKIVNGVVMKQD